MRFLNSNSWYHVTTGHKCRTVVCELQGISDNSRRAFVLESSILAELLGIPVSGTPPELVFGELRSKLLRPSQIEKAAPCHPPHNYCLLLRPLNAWESQFQHFTPGSPNPTLASSKFVVKVSRSTICREAEVGRDGLRFPRKRCSDYSI